MSQRKTFLKSMKTLWLAGLFLGGMSVFAGPVPPATTATTTNVQSVFIQPAGPKDGRDPFYPASTRPYQSAVVAAKTAELNLNLLVLQGISGEPAHRLVIINKRTFAVGDNLEVSTSQGRIRVHCLEINDNSVVIEANGQRHELRYDPKQ
jgi:hypothetical protein